MSPQETVPVEVLLSQREWVRSLARRLVVDEADADDLAQEIWVDVLRSPPRHVRGLRGWFATLLRRRARDAWRGESRRASREEAAARTDASRATADVVAEAEAHRMVVDAAMALEEPYRETILLRFFEDLPPRDVAARQGVPVETVRTRTRRALARLRDRLDAGGGGRGRWMALLLPITGASGTGIGRGSGQAPSAPAASGTVAALLASQALVVGGVLVALGLAAVLGRMLLTGGPGDPAAAPASDAAEGRPAPAPPPQASPSDPAAPPPPSFPAPPPAAAGTAAPPGVMTRATDAEPDDRLLLKGRVRNLDGEGVGGVDLVAWLESSDLVPPPSGARLEEREGEDLTAFYGQVAKDGGRHSVRGRTKGDGTFVLELPVEGRYSLVAFARRTAVLLERDEIANGLVSGAVVRWRALTRSELQRAALDRERPAPERIDALGILGTVRGGRSAGVAAAMIDLLPRLEDPLLRRLLLRRLRGEPQGGVSRGLVEVMRNDGEDEVRAEAALALGDYRGDPLIVATLEEVRDGDVSERVRAAAAEALRTEAKPSRK